MCADICLQKQAFCITVRYTCDQASGRSTTKGFKFYKVDGRGKRSKFAHVQETREDKNKVTETQRKRMFIH